MATVAGDGGNNKMGNMVANWFRNKVKPAVSSSSLKNSELKTQVQKLAQEIEKVLRKYARVTKNIE